MFFKNYKKIKSYDLIVVGNSLSAVISAGRAAKSGKTVALVTQSELLAAEMSEGLTGFVREDVPLYDLLLELGAAPVRVGEEYHVPGGMASKIALEYLIKNKVNLFLKAAPVALLTSGERVSGIAVATKFGAYALKGGFVADFSERIFYKTEAFAESDFVCAFQMGGVLLDGFNTPHPLEADMENLKDITLHGDCRSGDTCIITFKTGEISAADGVCLANRLAQYLIKNNPAFKTGGILKYSLRPIAATPRFNTPLKNLLEFKTGDFMNNGDYYNALVFASDLVNKFTENPDFNEPDILKTSYGEFDLKSLYTGEELDDFLGAELLKINFPTENMPEIDTELFIAGLGAGGAAAMKSALEGRAEVVCAEALPLPAGTRGQGMVSAFWHGYQGGFATENLLKVKGFGKEKLGNSVPTYTAETAYDISLGREAEVFYESLVFAAIKSNGNTCGAVIATPKGLLKITANKLIDATGDADLAMLSGAEYMPNGDPRDRVTQGFSVWGEEKIGTAFPDSLYKSDEDSISTESYSEFLRGIYTAHSKQSDYGFSALLTVRESRRIKGKYTLNMKDILSGRRFDDTLSVSLCKYDAHGVGSSPAYYTRFLNSMRGKQNPDTLTRIPLRALLPENDDGLMVISKAISATRDAGCLIRMNPDIQNTGYAAGFIAAAAAKGNLDFQSAYTEDIKNLLIEKQILPDFYNKSEKINNTELMEKIKSGDDLAMTYASVTPELLPLLENEDNENCRLAALALGSEKPFEGALFEFGKLIKNHCEEKNSSDRIKTYAILLSRVAAGDKVKKELFLPVLASAIEIMDAGGGYGDPARGIYQNSKVSNRIVPNFKTIMGICIAAETVADKILAEPLVKLSAKPNIRLSDGDEIHSVQLYLRIMAAAARCGSHDAKAELEKFSESERLFFREFVKGELKALNSAKTDTLPTEIGEFWV